MTALLIARSKIFLLPILLVWATCSGSEVYAQGLKIETKEQVFNQRQVGWEHVLVDKDPNLAHWHWIPITNSYRNIQTRNIYSRTQPLTQAAGKTSPVSPAAKQAANMRSAVNTHARIIRQAQTSNNTPAQPLVYSYAPSNPSRTRAAQQTKTKVAGQIIRVRGTNI